MRAIALKMGKALGQSFVVENRTGANGNIGMQIAARAHYALLLTPQADAA